MRPVGLGRIRDKDHSSAGKAILVKVFYHVLGECNVRQPGEAVLTARGGADGVEDAGGGRSVLVFRYVRFEDELGLWHDWDHLFLIFIR